ncbi:MAG: diacylglycerol kinase family protein [Candidatus Aminicenantes bacterium]|jgi:diacylglycerol kinase family enzyme
MIVLLNKNSNNGRGLKKWEKYRPELEQKSILREYTVVSDQENFSQSLRREVKNGERFLVSAGGDGTIHFLLNQVMRIKKRVRQELVLGAIGLGSSNDFHKPYSPAKRKNGRIPVRLDHKKAELHNVGQVDFEDESGKWQRKYFVINSSIGIIAQANYLFNSSEKIVRWLKSRWVEGTIWYSALKTLFASRNIPVKIKIGSELYSTEVTSLSVLINPHVSGSFCYDFNLSPQSDFLRVALCEKMGLLSRLRTLFSLARSKFSGLPKTRSWRADAIEIHSSSPTPLELDGEVYVARRIKIKLLQGVLKVSQ